MISFHKNRIIHELVRRNLKYLGRFRFIKKAYIVHKSPKKKNYLRKLLFLLISGETDTFTYNIRIVPDYVLELSKALQTDKKLIHFFLNEIQKNRKLRRKIFRKTFTKIFYLKCRMPLGRYYTNYVSIRAFKPNLVLECGTKFGTGAIVIYEALTKNYALSDFISIDIVPNSGEIFKNSLVIGDSIQVISQIDKSFARTVIISDSIKSEDHILREIHAALQITTDALLLIANFGWITEEILIAEFSEKMVSFNLVTEKPNHAIIDLRTSIIALIRK